MKRVGASVVQQSKFFVVPALVVGGWVLLFGSVLTPMRRPTSLAASIDKVLTHPGSAEPATTLVAVAHR
jgi:hypothetical protein